MSKDNAFKASAGAVDVEQFRSPKWAGPIVKTVRPLDKSHTNFVFRWTYKSDKNVASVSKCSEHLQCVRARSDIYLEFNVKENDTLHNNTTKTSTYPNRSARSSLHQCRALRKLT